ncbi:hypothetical protein DPMN_069758 [Dreissena polymorpha]|uniref:Uncharacterized protein n=1 Tax=Dreissena polymorpha TaxID=45954 RepID=A0A9D4BX28_DREPO|nr:hypothetical protein DPMN_069758 [Dreissena polymorpha]
MLTVDEAVDSGVIKYLDKENGRYILKKNSKDGYYAQAQGLLGITGLSLCNLVVWITRDMVTVPIHFDYPYFEKMVGACQDFF